jgi:hypothetical protein
MTKTPKEFGLIVAGVILGLLLFWISGLVPYGRPGGCIALGYPYFWNIRCTGPSGFRPSPLEPQYEIDLAFWLITCVIVVELCAHLVQSYLGRSQSGSGASPRAGDFGVLGVGE